MYVRRPSVQMLESVSMLQGKLEQPVRSAQLQLLANMCAMRLHRSRADEKLGGDFPAGFAIGNPFQNAPFRRGEIFQARNPAGPELPPDCADAEGSRSWRG